MVDGRDSRGFFNSFYLYNISSNSWITMPRTHYARDGVSFWVLGNRIFVGDGRDQDSLPHGLPYLEEFDLNLLGSQTTTTNMTTIVSSASTVTTAQTTSFKTNTSTLTSLTIISSTRLPTTIFTVSAKHTTTHSVRTISAAEPAANLLSFCGFVGLATAVGLVVERQKLPRTGVPIARTNPKSQMML